MNNDMENFIAFATRLRVNKELSDGVDAIQEGLIALGMEQTLATQFGETIWSIVQLAFVLGEDQAASDQAALKIETEGH